MAYSNSRGNSGDRPERRSSGPKKFSDRTDRSSSGEGKKIFNRAEKGRPSDSRDRKPYGDKSRAGGYGDKPRTDRPYNAERKSDRPYNREGASGGDRPYNKDRASSDRSFSKDRSASDRPYHNRNSDRPYNPDRSERANRSEGSDGEFRPYKPAGARRPEGGEDRPWVKRASRSEFGSVPRGGRGERNRSFKPEKEEYRSRKEEGSTAAPRRDEDGFAPREEKRSFERPERRPFGDERTERSEGRSYSGDRKPYAKKGYGSDDRKSFGGERGYSKDRGFSKEDRGSEGRFTKGMRASRESQKGGNSFEKRAPREGGFNREERPAREGRPYNDYSGARERRPFGDERTDRPERGTRGERPERAGRGGRPERSNDRRGPASSEPTSEAPNYSGLKRYASKGKNSRSEDLADKDELRLNRYIANAGVCSRREADELIAAGEIKVNGEVVTELGYKVKPTDTVQYGKKNLNREKLVYVLLNKPKDFITTTEDPEGRKTVMDLVAKASKERIFPVGRLDRNTTGLLLFTNDGELAQKLTHPSHKNSKIYQVELDKPITKDHFEQIVAGLELEDGRVEVDDLALLGDTNKFLGIEIHLGRNRIVRRIFESLGYDVVALDRVQYAGLTKKDLPRGDWRYLTEKEVIRLKYFLK